MGPINQELINSIKGNSTSRELSALELQLVLIQSACLIALEGKNRASASDVASRAMKEYGIEASASFTGQVFSALGIGSVTTHGKNRLVLEHDRLDEIRKDLAGRCTEKIAKLKEAIEDFGHLPHRIKELDVSWKLVQSQRMKEQELVRLINEDRRNPSRLAEYQAEYQKVQKRNEYIEAVKQEIKSLEQKEKRLPSLEDRKAAVQARIAEHEKAMAAIEAKEKDTSLREQQITRREQDAASREEAISTRLIKLQKLLDRLELASLDEEIEKAKAELDSLSRQLGEKRSLLDKMLGRKKGADQ